MSTSGDAGKIETFESGAMKPFDLRVIERELRDLWKDKDQKEGEKPKQATMRACVLNLLIYEDNPQEMGTLVETIIDVTKHHPSRVVIMSTVPNSLRDSIMADVSAVCHFVPGRGKQVCSEQITVAAEGAAVKRLGASVLPLLVADMPVTLWWRGVPIDGQPFHGLLDNADRVILDSSYSQRPTAFLSVLATMVRDRFKQVAFSDINWSRLTQLRSHVAGLFDVPDLRTYLKDLSKLSIEYPSSTADQELPSPQTMLFLGWFASRLQWDLTPEIFRSKSGGYLIKFKKGERDISVDLTPVTTMGKNDLKLTLTMADNTGWQEARMLITRNYSNNAIETKLETPTICWLKNVARYEMPGEAELISRELEILGHDSNYECALDHAGRIIEQL